ncbi:hypothetical protein ACLB1N_29355 [Escherichia coli]
MMFWRSCPFGLIGIHFGRPLQHEGESKGRLTLIHILLGTEDSGGGIGAVVPRHD